MKKNLVSKYKVHLMPRDENIFTVLSVLIQAIEKNSLLGSLIVDFKIVMDLQDSNKNIMPVFVIYSIDGKENVQKLVDMLCVMFKDVKGSGKIPRFN